jgi:hypothetical protein
MAPCRCGGFAPCCVTPSTHSCCGQLWDSTCSASRSLTPPADLCTCLPAPACAHVAHPLPAAGAKEFVSWTDLADRVPVLLEEIQADMFKAAKAKFDACLETVGLLLVPAAGSV